MYVERDIQGVFDRIKGVYNVIALVGARQAGKTTFLKHQIGNNKASYVLFDDPDARNLFNEDIKKFENQYLEGYDVSILDEVQYCSDAGQKIKYLADKGRHLWITSSSETLLGEKILSYLVGRVSPIRMYPFSIEEYLTAAGVKEATNETIKRIVWEHLTYGGYPKAVLIKDVETKKIILRDLYETMILKDVARTFSIEDQNTLEDLTRFLSHNVGTIVSYENVSSEIKISFPTLKKYLDALEKSYVLNRCPPYHTNKTKEITKQPKIYFLDTGLRNAITKTFDAEPDGRLFENYVHGELLKAGYSPKYWRTKSGAEADFVVEINDKPVPIEAKIKTKTGTVERSMKSFIETYKPRQAYIVSYEGETGEKQINGCTIKYLNIIELKKELAKTQRGG